MAVASGKWEDFMNLPNMRQYNKETIEAVVRKLTNVANGRLDRLESSNLTDTPSYANIANQYRNARFPSKLKNMSRNELLKQYSRLNWFLDNKTSTVKGAKQVVADFGKRLGTTLTKTQTENFWSVYNKLQELTNLTTELYYLDSNQVMQETAELITNPDFQNPTQELLDEMLAEMEYRVKHEYSKRFGGEVKRKDVIDDPNVVEAFDLARRK